MSVLLDTHALIWWVIGDPRLSRKARAAIEDGAEQCFVSAVTAFEIANKVRIGKLPAVAEIARNMDRIMRENSFSPLAVTVEHSLLGGSMDGSHRDLFDRLLAAQSIVGGMPLVTADQVFREFGVETIW